MYSIEIYTNGLDYYPFIEQIKSQGILVKELQVNQLNCTTDGNQQYRFNVIAEDKAELNLIKLLYNNHIGWITELDE